MRAAVINQNFASTLKQTAMQAEPCLLSFAKKIEKQRNCA